MKSTVISTHLKSGLSISSSAIARKSSSDISSSRKKYIIRKTMEGIIKMLATMMPCTLPPHSGCCINSVIVSIIITIPV